MTINHWIEAVLHLFYPSICQGCQSETVDPRQMICSDCFHSLPFTGFEKIPENPVEKLFWGRSRPAYACGLFYYLDQSPLQHIIHQIKYRNEKKLALRMGRMMGEKMQTIQEHLFSTSTYDQKNMCTVPMPMHPKKQRKRGYNQATLLCQGIAEETGIPYTENLVIKTRETTTQTKKSREDRWQNMASVFRAANMEPVQSKHLILVDDVITTGASAEAVVNILLEQGAASVGVYSLAFTA